MHTHPVPIFCVPAGRHAVLGPLQHRQLDSAALRSGALLSNLLWAAAQAVAAQVMLRWPHGRILVLCGKGLNGADGFLCAELLRRQGRQVDVLSFFPDEALSSPTAWAQEQCKSQRVKLCDLSLSSYQLLIDGLLGAGLNRPLDAQTCALLKRVEQAQLPVCAIDLPSGLNGQTGQVMGGALKADCTVSFERFKPAHALLPGRVYCGDILLSDVGLPASAYDQVSVDTWINVPQVWSAFFPWPSLSSHKYCRGHALIIGGARLSGASRLAARAAQRVGTGLVTLQVPASVWRVCAAALESVMVTPIEDDFAADPRVSALLCGPGAGLNDQTRLRVLHLLATGKPTVLDADALSVFKGRPQQLWCAIEQTCVLTPHEGEFARLFDFDMPGKLERARAAAIQCGAVVVLKGADTVIAAPDGRCCINVCAPPFLATAGSGDVLAGLITGLLAQGMPAFEAAAAAVWIHAQAALLHGPGLIPEDILAGVPYVLGRLLSEPVAPEA